MHTYHIALSPSRLTILTYLGAEGEMQVTLLPGPWVTGSLALKLVCIEASIPGLAAGLEAEEV